MMPNISVMSPTLPTNINAEISSLILNTNREVESRLEPTVLMAEIHSKTMLSIGISGCHMDMRKIEMNRIPKDMMTVVFDRRIES